MFSPDDNIIKQSKDITTGMNKTKTDIATDDGGSAVVPLLFMINVSLTDVDMESSNINIKCKPREEILNISTGRLFHQGDAGVSC